MSMEEDIELRDLLTQTLESNGCLAKIRAQLRASIFIALEEDVNISKQRPLFNNKLVSFQSESIGKTMFCLVREFFDFFDLKYTASVYDSESYLDTGGYKYEGRNTLIRDLGIRGLEDGAVEPLLLQVLRIAQRNLNNQIADIKEGGDLLSQPSPDPPKSEDRSKTINKSTSSNSNCFNCNGDMLLSDVMETAENSRTEDHFVESDLKTELSSIYDEEDKSSIKPEVPRVTMNATFNVSDSKFVQGDHSTFVSVAGILETVASPLSCASGADDARSTGSNKDETEKDDTYEGTSSIAEDNNYSQSSENDGHSIGNNDSKPDNGDDHKVAELNQKDSDSDKVVVVVANSDSNNVRSLSDLPPLNPNKSSRFSELPKFTADNKKKKKVNLSDIDKMFDLRVDYEEDFVSGTGSDVDLKDNAISSGTRSVNGPPLSQ